MNKVEKIKAYLERRIAEITDVSQGYIASKQMSTEYLLLFELLSYIDSLQDTEKDFGIKSNDLEEAAHSYVDTTIEWFDSEGNPCCYPAFIAGAQWQKQQLLDKACEWLKSYRQYTSDGAGYIPGIINDETIEDFKQSMEE